MGHRIIAFAIFVLSGVLSAPAYAEGWSDWKLFASHNGVVLEWRTYSHPEHDKKADWRITNNTTEVLFNLALGTRTYMCSDGSVAFPKMRSNLGGLELRPGASVATSGSGAADYIGADHIDRASCPRIVEASFDEGVSWALEFGVGGPYEPVKPWMEHSFAAERVVSTCRSSVVCSEITFESKSEYIASRDTCLSNGGEAEYDALCARAGAYVCRYYFEGKEVRSYYYHGHDANPVKEIDYINVCEDAWGGTYMGRQ